MIKICRSKSNVLDASTFTFHRVLSILLDTAQLRLRPLEKLARGNTVHFPRSTVHNQTSHSAHAYGFMTLH